MKSIVFYIYINLFIILNQPYLLLISSTTVLLNANISLQDSNTLTVDVLKPTVNTSFYNITYYGLNKGNINEYPTQDWFDLINEPNLSYFIYCYFIYCIWI